MNNNSGQSNKQTWENIKSGINEPQNSTYIEWEEKKQNEPIQLEDFLNDFIKSREEHYNSLKETVRNFDRGGTVILLQAIEEVYPNLILCFLAEKRMKDFCNSMKFDFPKEEEDEKKRLISIVNNPYTFSTERPKEGGFENAKS